MHGTTIKKKVILDLKKKVMHFFVSQNTTTGILIHTDLYKLHHLAVISFYLPVTNLYQLGVSSVTHSQLEWNFCYHISKLRYSSVTGYSN
jgi:hypothetical protein